MEKTKPLHPYMHLSVDDVYFILKELDEGPYASIYEHKVFQFFKAMHEQYGAVFSLFCFYRNVETDEWTLANMTDKFKEEFKNAASWLRFGFHAEHSTTKYDATIKPEDSLTHYNQVIDAIKNFASVDSIDTIPRIHFFGATVESVRNWRDANNGVIGFLAADDNRTANYYLNATERNHLQMYSDYFEPIEKLYFFKTNIRLENISEPYKLLETAKKNNSVPNQQAIKIIFTHEKYLYTQEILEKIEDCCRWAVDNHFVFTYPMDTI